jgi:transposase-like protein
MELVDAAGALADQVAAPLLQHRQHDRGIVGLYRLGVALQGRDTGRGGRIQHVGLAATPARQLADPCGCGGAHVLDGLPTSEQPLGEVAAQGTVASVGSALSRQTTAMRTRYPCPAPVARSAFAGFCFPPDVIVLAVRWYLRFGLSYRDVEELLAERGVQVDHVTVYRWVQRFTPLLAEAARPCRHGIGDRWQVDETYVKVAGRWRYVYRAIDQFGQVIDVFVSSRRDATASRRFFQQAIGTTATIPAEVVTDRAAAYAAVLDELLPMAWHRTEQYANNRVEADHGRLKAAAATDARAQAGPQRQGRDRRARLGAERPPGALRTGGRGAGDLAAGRRVR